MTIRKGPEFDRWLMRAKDIVQIILAICSATYAGFKFVQKIDQMNSQMVRLQAEVSEMRIQVMKQRGDRHGT